MKSDLIVLGVEYVVRIRPQDVLIPGRSPGRRPRRRGSHLIATIRSLREFGAVTLHAISAALCVSLLLECSSQRSTRPSERSRRTASSR
jgi:hypothetical protein